MNKSGEVNQPAAQGQFHCDAVTLRTNYTLKRAGWRRHRAGHLRPRAGQQSTHSFYLTKPSSSLPFQGSPAQKDTGPTPDIEHDSRNAAPTVQLAPQGEEHTHTHRARAARDHTPVPTLSASHERYFNSTPIIFRSVLIPDARVARPNCTAEAYPQGTRYHHPLQIPLAPTPCEQGIVKK